MDMNLSRLTFALLLPLSASSMALAFDAKDFSIDGIPALESGHYNAAKGGVVWRDTLVRPGASELSVYLDAMDLGPRDYLIVSNGQAEHLFTHADGEDIWTEPLAGSVLTLTLIAAPGSQGDGVRVDRLRANLTPDPTYSIYQRNELVPIAEAPEDIYLAREAVARVYMAGMGYCTGFMISHDLLMTNNHCVSTASGCDNTYIQFNYEDDINGEHLEVDEYRCSELVETDQTLDYSILKIAGRPGYHYGFYELSPDDHSNGDQGVIIQHPGGDRKEASIAPNCTLGSVSDGNGNNSDFRHQCDTLSGSSGAPVMTEDLKVVGLHHFGGAGLLRRTANQAVRMSQILNNCQNCP